MTAATSFSYYSGETLQGLAEGDSAAFTRIYKAHYADLFFYPKGW